MTERVNIERFEKGAEPFFVEKEDHIEGELAIRDVVSVGRNPVNARVPEIGGFRLQSERQASVEGVYSRGGRSIKVNTPSYLKPQEVLPERLRFTLNKDNWIEFISWDGTIRTRLTILEDLPITSNVLAEELSPDPSIETSVALKVATVIKESDNSSSKIPALV